MDRRKTLSDLGVARLKPRSKRYVFPDPELVGHYVRVQPSGAKSYVAVARNPFGKKKQVWVKVGTPDLITIEEAREKAREAIKAIKDGESPAPPQSFKGVAEDWLKRHVIAKKLRTAPEIKRCLEKYAYPSWEDRDFTSMRRGDVADLLDQIQDDHGPRQADTVLTIVRSVCNWYVTRHEDYSSPIVRGMRRSDPQTSKRDRILDDDELRAIWQAGEGTFGAFVKVALLTAQRRKKVATMRWEDVSVDGEWRIPAEDREKGTGGSLVLPELALDIIRAQPRFASCPYVFAGRGGSHFNSMSKAKAALDAKVKIEQWGIHDLRRTARSLMSRAGVRPDIAERVMGHAIGGVEGIYDRHSYRDEKADALKRLAALVETILNGPVDNVISLTTARPVVDKAR